MKQSPKAHKPSATPRDGFFITKEQCPHRFMDFMFIMRLRKKQCEPEKIQRIFASKLQTEYMNNSILNKLLSVS